MTAGYGLRPYDWQDDVLDDWLARDRRGRWACSICGLAVPRQNGKNGVIEVREVFGMVALGEKFLHTAHEVKTARKAFKRLKHFFGESANDPAAKFPELNALVSEVRNTNGQEAIFLTNGGSVEIVARSKGSGRGYTVDVLVLDEAQDLTDDELEALLPTISAAPLRNPQVIYTGTPPDPEKRQTGEVFTRIRKAGNAKTKRMSWTDYGVADGPIPDINDNDLVAQCNPSLAAGALQMSVIEDERQMMSPEGVARERYGWWGDPDEQLGVSVFGPDDPWADRKVDTHPPPVVAIAVAVSLDRAWSSIGASSAGPVTHLGAVVRARGTHWVVDEACRIQDALNVPIVVDGKGPAASLLEAFEEAGADVLVAGTDDVLAACANLYDAVLAGGVEHGGYDDLDDAVRVATKRTVGDRWAWARKAGDISMLEAVTLARWGALQDTDSDAWGFFS